MENEVEERTIDLKLICNFVILVSIGMLLTGAWLLYNEYSGAKERCVEMDGEFEFGFPSGYFCDDKPLIKYNDGTWDYEREFKFNESNIRKLILP